LLSGQLTEQTTGLLGGTVEHHTFFSPALGIDKSYNIYLPPGYYQDRRRYPVLYLFRGHEKEWFDPYQDHSRGGTAIQHLADELILSGAVSPMIIVGVGLTSADGSIYGLGVNFVNPRLARGVEGIGSGLFETYLTRDVIGHIDATWRTRSQARYRGADGFSLGGFTAVMMGIKYPELFSSVGSYDGSYMFHNLHDPRRQTGRPDDRLWMRRDGMFAPAFRPTGKRRYDAAYMNLYNPLSLLEKMPSETRARLEKNRFYLRSASSDGHQGNRDRNVHLVTLFQLYGIRNHASSLILSSDAHHTWKFADLHMRETLRKHAEAFGFREKPIKRKRVLPNVAIKTVRDGNGVCQTPSMSYKVYGATHLRVEVCTLHGDYVTTLKDEVHHPGRHQAEWDGLNAHGHLMGSGVYFARITSPNGTIQQKWVFLR